MSKRRHNLGTKHFKEKSLFIFHARIALKSLILLFVRLIAQGGRIGKTHTQTEHRQSNPRACAPRVNDNSGRFRDSSIYIQRNGYSCGTGTKSKNPDAPDGSGTLGQLSTMEKVKEWLKNREQIGAYHQLIKEFSLREQSRHLFSSPSTKTQPFSYSHLQAHRVHCIYLLVPLHMCKSPRLLKCSVEAFPVGPLKLHAKFPIHRMQFCCMLQVASCMGGFTFARGPHRTRLTYDIQ